MPAIKLPWSALRGFLGFLLLKLRSDPLHAAGLSVELARVK
jgi:hypothetical protein